MSEFKDLYQFRNCEFAFKCDADWFELDETMDRKIRFCNMCQKQVHRCDTEAELLAAIKSNLCVAIDPPYQKLDSNRVLMGSMRAVKPAPISGDE
jgi:hypothetical protein